MENVFLAYTLIVVGLLLLAAELLLPTGGILFVLGVAGLIAGLAMTFYKDPLQGLLTLIGVFILIPIMGPILINYWPKTKLGKKFFLTAAEEDDATVATMPVNLELEALRGRYGKTVSALRPAGITEFHGRRIDTLSEGDMIDAGQWVKCVDVRAGKVIVRPVERPPELGDLNADDLKRDL